MSPASLEALLGHSFARPDLLREALTHRSALQRRRPRIPSNERLEFLGDRVLGLLIAEWLLERFPHEPEGHLGRRLGHLVSQPVLAAVAEEIGIRDALDVAPEEEKTGVKHRATVLADALEAALGALYLDGGLEAARDFVRRAWDASMEAQQQPPKDPKSRLQEWAHRRTRELPAYEVVSRAGPSHAPEFVATVTVGEKTGTGVAGSKQQAERLAAEDLLRQITR